MPFLILLMLMAAGDVLWWRHALRQPRRWMRWTGGIFAALQLGGLAAILSSRGGPLLYRYWSGLYTRRGSTLVVSNGVGNWFPVRIQAPAEIIHLTLRAGAGPDSLGSENRLLI